MPWDRMRRPVHRRHTAVCGADRQRVWARASVSGGVSAVGGELVERQCARQATGHGARNTDRLGQLTRADKTKGLRPWRCPLRQWCHEGILPVFRSAGIIRSLKVHSPTLPPQTASVVRVGVPRRDAKTLRELGRNYQYGAGRLSVGSVEIASGKCLLLPGDNIVPNNLTMPSAAPKTCNQFSVSPAEGSWRELSPIARLNETRPEKGMLP